MDWSLICVHQATTIQFFHLSLPSNHFSISLHQKSFEQAKDLFDSLCEWKCVSVMMCSGPSILVMAFRDSGCDLCVVWAVSHTPKIVSVSVFHQFFVQNQLLLIIMFVK